MREILFRGKQTDKDKWIYGMPVKGTVNDESTMLIIDRTFDCGEYACKGCEYTPVIPETVGQYTGLTDKNGKKIFEGDIVKDEQVQLFGKVVYATSQDGFDGTSGFMVDDIDDGMQNYNGFWHLVEIIGNIHDNPELLKGGADNA